MEDLWAGEGCNQTCDLENMYTDPRSFRVRIVSVMV